MTTATEVTEEQSDTGLSLRLDVDEVKQSLDLPETIDLGSVPEEVDPELEAQADEYVSMLISIDPENAQQHSEATSAVEEMGRALQQEAAHRSQMLQAPIKELSEHGSDGSPVANALVELKMKVEELDPNSIVILTLKACCAQDC